MHANLSARAAFAGECWPGCPPARPPGSRTAVLQRGPLRRTEAAGPCGLIQSGKSPVPFHTLRNRSGPEHLRRCASSMGFLSTPCTKSANDSESARWPSTSMRYSRKPWRVVPIAPSTASAWDRLAGCVFAVMVVASPASRTNATILDCALCCRNRKTETRAVSSGKTITCLPSSTGRTRRQAWPGSTDQIRPPDPAQSEQSTGARGRRSGLSLLRATRAGRHSLPQTETSRWTRHHRGGRRTLDHCPGPTGWRGEFIRLLRGLVPDEQGIRRLQRKMDRQWRAANPGNYDSRGRIKKAGGKKPLTWKQSKGYHKIRRCKAEKERKLAGIARPAWSQSP